MKYKNNNNNKKLKTTTGSEFAILLHPVPGN
jgi:hypothetical protein